MSFSSLLSELKGKPAPNYGSNSSLSSSKPNNSRKTLDVRSSSSSLSKPDSKNLVNRRSIPSKRVPNDVDPAVARLKAARQKEKEELILKKNKEKREKLIRMGINPDEIEKPKKKKTTATGAAQARPRNKSSTSMTKRTMSSRKKYDDENNDASTIPKKKLKFSELMKQAEMVDVSSTVNNGFSYDKQRKPTDSTSKKLSESRINKKPMTRNSIIENKRNPNKLLKGERFTPSNVNGGKSVRGQRLVNSKNERILKKNSTNPPIEKYSRGESRKPVGFRGPSEKLKKKLDARKKVEKKRSYYNEDSYDDEDDDFIVHDEGEDYDEEEADAGYDRNEIWSIFNRGKKNRSYDYDDYDDESDMEATGDQVFDEEDYSNRQALLEEKREKRLEKEHYRQKMKRLSRS